MKEQELERARKGLGEMGIPYTEDGAPENLAELAGTFGYSVSPIRVDLNGVDTVDAETGIIVQNSDASVDDGIYIFTVLHSGQAGFIVVEPGTISRAPLVRKVTHEVTNAINGIDLPPMMPFDMVEVVAHVLEHTVMGMVAESCRIPEEYREIFLHAYMPRFLSDVGMYFVGASREDGSPMVYEEIVNMEPMMVWRSMQKGADTGEGKDAVGGTGEAGTDGTAGEGEKEETPLP